MFSSIHTQVIFCPPYNHIQQAQPVPSTTKGPPEVTEWSLIVKLNDEHMWYFYCEVNLPEVLGSARLVDFRSLRS